MLPDNEFQAIATVKVGPVKARWKGKVRLSDFDPPNSYRISGEGEGGVAGFAKGGALVSLAEKDGGTLLSYNVEAQIGGKLAQLGPAPDQQRGEEDRGRLLRTLQGCGDVRRLIRSDPSVSRLGRSNSPKPLTGRGLGVQS